MNFKNKVEDSFDSQKFMHFIKAELTTIESGYCEISLPYSEHLTQQHGFFHAGIVGAIADNAAGYAGFSLMDIDSSVLTVEYKINLVSPAVGDLLIAKANVLKQGKTLTVCEAKVFAYKNNKEKLCAITQSTLMELRNTIDGKVE